MEKGFESWFQNQQIDWQSPNPNSSSPPIGLGSFGNMVSAKASVRQEPCGWFYGLPPRYRQGPAVDRKLLEAGPDDVGGVQKKFLVFDQSGDQTTLIYSSGGRIAPIRHHFPPSDNLKLRCGSHPLLHVDECVEENDGNGSRSEMREDTEELNALLYSDDDDDDDDGENEEMSTGHSPNSMTGFVERKRKNCEEEEVGSSVGPTKRHKREERGNIVNSLEDTASSGNGGNGAIEEESKDFSGGNKRVRKEKMKETISLLQNLIPGGRNDKNAIMVIDEAIHYLRSLKKKAKALGLDSPKRWL